MLLAITKLIQIQIPIDVSLRFDPAGNFLRHLLSNTTSLSLFLFYTSEKYLKGLRQPCSLQSAGEQEPRPQNVHHVDKLSQSASSRSISPFPLWNSTLLTVHWSVSGEGKEKVEERRRPHHLWQWQSERGAVGDQCDVLSTMYVCECVYCCPCENYLEF